MQEHNGPCPLLAAVNVLALRRIVRLDPKQTHIPEHTLLDLIANVLLEKHASVADKEPNRARLMEEAVLVIPKLLEGIHVNVKFAAVDAFEYTEELSVFELLGMQIVHGWVVDQQDKQAFEVLGGLGYNQAAELALGVGDEKDEGRSWIARRWLEDHQHQLTMVGLASLRSKLSEGSLSVLFRNNHFSVLHKREGRLYSLVTDSSFAEFPDVMWEELSDIGGDTRYLDADFMPVDFTTTTSNRSVESRPRSESNDGEECAIL
jgi:ubiquitin carboxyl-terminal hydrolase MINDY-1/2